jgi:hypothetical protein
VQWWNYKISLYKAKTGTLVTKPMVLLGEDNTACPKTVDVLSATGPHVEVTTPTIAQVQQALGKYVA